MTKKTVAQSNI